MKYLTIPDSVAKQRNQHTIILCCYRGGKKSPYFFKSWLISIEGFIILTDLLSSLWVWIMIFMDHVSKLKC